MQKHIHPAYRPVIFRDRSAGTAFLTNSTRSSERTVTWEDGYEYPVIDVEVSAASHPFLDLSRWCGSTPPAWRGALPSPGYADKIVTSRHPTA